MGNSLFFCSLVGNEQLFKQFFLLVVVKGKSHHADWCQDDQLLEHGAGNSIYVSSLLGWTVYIAPILKTKKPQISLLSFVG